jgi:hypothetical protein
VRETRHADSVQAAAHLALYVCLLNQGVPMSKAKNTTARLMCVSVSERGHNRIGPSEDQMPVALIGKTLSVTSESRVNFLRALCMCPCLCGRPKSPPITCDAAGGHPDTTGHEVLPSAPQPGPKPLSSRSLCSRSMIAVVRVTLRDMRILLNASSSLAYAVAVFSDWDQALTRQAQAQSRMCARNKLYSDSVLMSRKLR